MALTNQTCDSICARAFLPKYAKKCDDPTHYSFKGGRDEFCLYKGKWDIPDDPQTQKDLALVIEHLYEHAKNDEGREFPYIIELNRGVQGSTSVFFAPSACESYLPCSGP